MHLRVRCPAKVNLFLSVGPKDARNYHPIRTIFQAIDLCDTLVIRSGAGKHVVECDDPSVPANNTVTKALRLLNEVLPLPPLHVTIQKQIPAESGLGGGSSNAAGIIRAAQAIVGATIPYGELKGVAEAVGMDVPFFLVGGKARGEGYGEQVTALEDAPTSWLVVARPTIGCSTPIMYCKLDENEREWHPFSEADVLFNDFESVVPQECIQLKTQLLELGATDAVLSGSGSAVFGRFQNEEAAKKAASKIDSNQDSRVWVCRTLSRGESLLIVSD